jgi:endonuclease/exonuclease/phosphatase family metal-dependent hydrolase
MAHVTRTRIIRGRTVRICCALLLAACATGGHPAAEPIRVIVYNTHAGTDAKRVSNLDRVAQIINDANADIVLLQEVDSATRRSGGIDQVARLRALTGYHGVFGRAIDYDGGKYGIAILSRWPISSDTLIHLPVAEHDSSYEARGALVAKISSPQGTLRVINTHLEAYRNSYRLEQARALAAIASAQRDSGTTIIGGDFNSEPGSGVIAIFEQSGWKDAFAQCGTGSGLSFPANVPVKRIDYLLFSGTTKCASAKVLETEASDHRPVLFVVVNGRG